MKKDLFFLIESPYPYYSGGIETWLYNITSRVSDRYNVTILSEEYPNSNGTPHFILPSNIRHLCYNSYNKYGFYRYLTRTSFRYLDILNISGQMYKVLKKSITRPSETIVFALGTLASSRAAMLIKNELPSIKYICSARGLHAETEVRRIKLFKNLYYRLELHNMKRADLILVNGFDTQSYYESKGLSTSVMKNGVDPAKFLPSYSDPYQGKKVVVSVATLIEIKCIKELIESFSLMINKYKINDVYLYLVGKGDQSEYKKLSSRLGVEKFVCFTGNQTNVVPYLKYAKVATCLSGGGGFSMAALESMMSGCPVVAWDTPVYQQFNKDRTSLELVKEKDIYELSEKIYALLVNDTSDLIKNAKITSNSYRWDVVVSDFINYIER